MWKAKVERRKADLSVRDPDPVVPPDPVIDSKIPQDPILQQDPVCPSGEGPGIF